MDRRLLRGVRALRGEAWRHGGDPLGNAVAATQCASGGARIAAAWRAAVPYRRADPAQPPSGAGALDGSERGDRAARAGRIGAGTGGLRRRLHARRPDARARDAGDPESRRTHSRHLQRASGGAGAHGARQRTGGESARGGEIAARRQTHARQPRRPAPISRRHGGRRHRRRVGLDRQAGHARALAGRDRGELPEGRHGQRHAGARPRRYQSDLQALSGDAGAPHAGGRLRHARRRRRARMPR